MKFNEAKEESKRYQGSKTDKYIFTRKNNRYASKKYGNYDWSQVNNPDNDSDDAKDYKKSVKGGGKDAYLTKVNHGYKIKI